MAGPWPLVGRRTELRAISRALADLECQGIVLAGGPGFGKSRLLREGLAVAKSSGWATEWVTGLHVVASIPMGAFAHLLPMPETQLSDHLSVLRQLSHELTERSRGMGARLVLGVDDAHLLDDGSAALVHDLATRGRAIVLLALRTGETLPGPILALWRDDAVERLDVQLLTLAEAQELVPTALGGPVAGATVHELWSTSGGNPLWLRELVLGGLDSGALCTDRGVWRTKGVLADNPRLLEVVEARLADLTSDERRVVDLAAMGEPLSVTTIKLLTAPGSLESVERRGLVEVVADARRLAVRLAHPLYSEVLRAGMPPLSARTIQRDLADALGATGCRRRGDLLRAGTLHLEAGTRSPPGLLLAAAANAMALFDFDLGERLARASFEVGGGFPAELALAQAFFGQQRGDAAEDVLASLTLTSDTDEARTSVAILRASNLFWVLGRPEEAEEIVTRASASISDVARRDELAALRATFLFFYASTTEVLAAVSGPLSRSETSDGTLVQCLLPSSGALIFSGQIGAGLQQIARGRAAAGRRDGELALVEHQFRLIEWCGLWLGGRVADAHRLAHDTYAEAIAAKAHEVAAHWCMELGFSLLLVGRLATSAEKLREAAVLLHDHDRWGFRHCSLAFLAQAAAAQGDLATAAGALEEAEAGQLRSFRQLDGLIALAPAWIACSRGEMSHAVDLALRAAELSRTASQHAFEAVALHEVARLGRPARVLDPLAELAARSDGALVRAFLDHAVAAAGHDGAALDEVSERFASMGTVLYAAEAAAEAAMAHARVTRKAKAVSSRARAVELASLCEGARTPGLSCLAQPLRDPLTSREREISQLAAGGMTSREIAERMVLSVRTVENHLYRAYIKLGISRRSQLNRVPHP